MKFLFAAGTAVLTSQYINKELFPLYSTNTVRRVYVYTELIWTAHHPAAHITDIRPHTQHSCSHHHRLLLLPLLPISQENGSVRHVNLSLMVNITIWSVWIVGLS